MAKALYGIGSTFDDVGDTIRTMTGKTGDELDSLVDVAKHVGTSIPASFEDIAPVVGTLNERLGLTGDTLQTVASQALEAGRIMDQDIDVDGLAKSFAAFNIEGEDTVTAMDRLFQVAQATGVPMNDLASSAQQNAAAFQNLGFSFDETVSLAGSLDKAGLNSTSVMAGMGKGLVKLAKAGEEPQDAFKRVTSEIEDLIKQGDIAGAIDLASGIFGTRGANQFVGAVQQGTLSLDDLVGNLETTNDTILGVADETADFSEKWQVFKNKALVAIEPVASAIFDGFGKAFGVLQTVGAWFVNTKPILAAFGVVVLASLMPAIIAMASAVWGAVTATAAWTVALLTNPITWIVLGIAALVAGLVALIQNWDAVVQWLKDVWGAIVDWLQGIWDAICAGFQAALDWIKGIWETVWGAIKGFFEAIWNGISAFFSAWWNAIVTVVTTYINVVKTVIMTVFNAVKTAIEAVWNGIKAFFETIWNGIKNTVSTVINTIRDTISGVFNGIKNTLEGIWNGITGTVRSVWEGIKGIISTAIDKIKGFFTGIGDVIMKPFQAAIDGFKKLWNMTLGKIHFSVPSWIPGIGGKEFGFPMLAEGGVVNAATLAMIGEAGPEVVYPLDKLRADLRSMVAGLEIKGGVVQGDPIQIDQASIQALTDARTTTDLSPESVNALAAVLDRMIRLRSRSGNDLALAI